MNAASGGRLPNLETLIIESLDVIDSMGSQFDFALSHRNRQGHTMLHLAVLCGFDRLALELLEHGIELDVADLNGFTALHFAAWMGRSEFVRLLVEYHADVWSVNAQGKRAVDLAMAGGFFDLNELLEEGWVSEDANSSSYAASSEQDDWASDDSTDEESDEESSSLGSDEEGRVLPNADTNRGRSSLTLDANCLTPCESRKSSRHRVVDAEPLEMTSVLDDNDASVAPDGSMSAEAEHASSWLHRTFSHIAQTASFGINLPNIAKSTKCANRAPLIPSLQNLDLKQPMKNMTMHGFSLPNVANVAVSLANVPLPSFPTLIPTSFPPSFVSARAATVDGDFKDENPTTWLIAAPSPDGSYHVFPHSVVDGKKQSHILPRKFHHQSQYPLAEGLPASLAESQFIPMDMVLGNGEGSSTLTAQSVEGSIASESADERWALAHIEKRKKTDKNLYTLWIPLLLLMVAIMLYETLGGRSLLSHVI